MIWRALDAIADWLRTGLGYRMQLRVGIAIVVLTIPLYPMGFFTSEPRGVWLMSTAALTLTGITWVIAAEAANEARRRRKSDGDP
jgi:hypothetical protein